jgi:hypothetical protein
VIPVGLVLLPRVVVVVSQSLDALADVWNRVKRLWREGRFMEGVTEPHYRAGLQQEARRLRFHAASVRGDDAAFSRFKVAALFADRPESEARKLWLVEREQVARLFEEAARVLEDGSGGIV